MATSFSKTSTLVKPAVKSLLFETIYHPTVSFVLPSGDKVSFKEGKYKAVSETQAGLLEKHFSNAIRRV